MSRQARKTLAAHAAVAVTQGTALVACISAILEAFFRVRAIHADVTLAGLAGLALAATPAATIVATWIFFIAVRVLTNRSALALGGAGVAFPPGHTLAAITVVDHAAVLAETGLVALRGNALAARASLSTLPAHGTGPAKAIRVQVAAVPAGLAAGESTVGGDVLGHASMGLGAGFARHARAAIALFEHPALGMRTLDEALAVALFLFGGFRTPADSRSEGEQSHPGQNTHNGHNSLHSSGCSKKPPMPSLQGTAPAFNLDLQIRFFDIGLWYDPMTEVKRI